MSHIVALRENCFLPLSRRVVSTVRLAELAFALAEAVLAF